MSRYHLTALIAATTLLANTASATTTKNSKGKNGNNGWYTPVYKPVKTTEVFELLCGPQGPEVIKPQPPVVPPLPNGTPGPVPPQNVVPEPGTYLLMATGLMGIALITRRRRAPQL